MTYVSNVDEVALVAVGGSVVSERVGRTSRNGRSALVISTTGVTTGTRRATEAAAAAKATAEATTSSKSTTTSHGSTETTTATHGATEATAAAKATGTTAGEAIFTDLKGAALPVVTVELRNGVTGVLRGLESDDTRALGASSGVSVHVGTDNATHLGCDKDSSQLTTLSD
jgi:hypothetical protein